MDLAVTKEGIGWTIRLFDGTVVAHVESLNMSRVRFVGNAAIGKVETVWGAVIMEAAYTLGHVNQTLGIGKPFSNPRGARIVLRKGGWVDHKTGEPVAAADYLVLHEMIAYYTESTHNETRRTPNPVPNRSRQLRVAVPTP